MAKSLHDISLAEAGSEALWRENFVTGHTKASRKAEKSGKFNTVWIEANSRAEAIALARTENPGWTVMDR